MILMRSVAKKWKVAGIGTILLAALLASSGPLMAAEATTSILGAPQATKEQVLAYLRTKDGVDDYSTDPRFVPTIGEAEGYNGVYNIRSKNSGLLMDVYRGGRIEGDRVIQWPKGNNQLNQQWTFQELPDGYYKITSVLNPKFSLDVYQGGTKMGQNVIQYTYNTKISQINQKWKLIPHEDGSVSFKSQLSEINGSDYVLDVYGGGKTAGVNVITWANHGGDNQCWYLDPVAPRTAYVHRDAYLQALVDEYYAVGALYGVRADVAIFQAIHETGFFKYGGDVKINDLNFSGIYAIGRILDPATDFIYSADPARVRLPYGEKRGAIFTTMRDGVEAHIQHLYGYAVTDTTNDAVVDSKSYAVVSPRYNLLGMLGKTSDSFEGLGGQWAVPGYGAPYTSFEEAYAAGQTYGQKIVTAWKTMLSGSY